MKIVSVPPSWVLSFLAALVLFQPGRVDAGEAKDADAESRALVVPSTISPDARIARSMWERSVSMLSSLEYETVPSKDVDRVLRRANPNNVQACLDETLVALGRAVGADLIVCPRIVNRARGEVRVTFARISKDRIWSCDQTLDSSSGLRTDNYLDAVTFCMDQLLSSAPKTAGKARTQKVVVVGQRRKSARKNYLGASGLLVPASRERFTAYDGEQRFSKHLDYGFSWGASLFYERRNLSWVAVGVQLDWYSLGNRKSGKSSEAVGESGEPLPGSDLPKVDRLNAFNIAAALRLFYPGQWIEPYIKAALGITIAAAREGEVYRDVAIGAGFGANYQLRAGLMAVFSYLGIFVDLGLVDMMWIPSTEAFAVFESAMVNDVCFSLNLGLAFVF